MEKREIISGQSEKEIIRKLTGELSKMDEMLGYYTEIKLGGKTILFNVDIDPGGGFESGDEITSLRAPLKKAKNFSFAIHRESILRDIGKLFGMQDIKIGYPAFDKKFIIKSNDKERTRKIFADTKVRAAFSSLPDFTFKISSHKTKNKKGESHTLELVVFNDSTEVKHLIKIYQAYYAVLNQIEA